MMKGALPHPATLPENQGKQVPTSTAGAAASAPTEKTGKAQKSKTKKAIDSLD
jgi:hypothetical protein